MEEEWKEGVEGGEHLEVLAWPWHIEEACIMHVTSIISLICVSLQQMMRSLKTVVG